MSDDAPEAVAALVAAGATVATAESLTGGLLCATLVGVPGASAVVRGGVVAYAADVKTSALGVPAEVVREHGTVSDETAAAMARGAASALGATWAVSTTGVAGPDPSEGKPVGRVHVAVAGPSGVTVERLDLPGDRAEVRRETVRAALSALVARLGEETTQGRR